MKILVLVLLGLVGLVVLALVAMRVAIAVQIKKRRGQPAPDLEGPRGVAMKKGRALFYFHSPGCAACRQMTPVVDELSRGDKGVFSIDISQDMDTARQFGVMATPTTIFVKSGIVEEILVGPQSKAKLREMMV